MRQASPLDESLTQHMYNLSSALQCQTHTLDAAHLSHLRVVVCGNNHSDSASRSSIHLPLLPTTQVEAGTTRRKPPITSIRSCSQAINYRKDASSRARDLQSRGHTGSMWLLVLGFRVCPAVCLQPRACHENARNSKNRGQHRFVRNGVHLLCADRKIQARRACI
jgi:hypothetical protein